MATSVSTKHCAYDRSIKLLYMHVTVGNKIAEHRYTIAHAITRRQNPRGERSERASVMGSECRTSTVSAAAASRADQIDPNANAAGRSVLCCTARSGAVTALDLVAELNVGRQIFRSDCRGQRETHGIDGEPVHATLIYLPPLFCGGMCNVCN